MKVTVSPTKFASDASTQAWRAARTMGLNDVRDRMALSLAESRKFSSSRTFRLTRRAFGCARCLATESGSVLSEAGAAVVDGAVIPVNFGAGPRLLAEALLPPLALASVTSTPLLDVFKVRIECSREIVRPFPVGVDW